MVMSLDFYFYYYYSYYYFSFTMVLLMNISFVNSFHSESGTEIHDKNRRIDADNVWARRGKKQ